VQYIGVELRGVGTVQYKDSALNAIARACCNVEIRRADCQNVVVVAKDYIAHPPTKPAEKDVFS
jgi:hypothetical protein